MSWQYSDPLSDALVAAAAVSNSNRAASDIGLGSSSLYRQYYSGYDPIISRYETRRQNKIYRPIHSDLLDDIDDLALEMEAENLFASSRRTNLSSTYVPTATTTSLFLSQNSLVDHADKATATSFIEDDGARSKRKQAADLNNKASQIPKQPPPKTNNGNKNQNTARNGLQNNDNHQKTQKQRPQAPPQQAQPQQANHNQNHQFQSRSNPQLNHGSDTGYNYNGAQYENGYYQPIIMAPFIQPNFTPNQQHIQVQPHDSQSQRLLQFQNRIMQQQFQPQQQFGNNNAPMSELEMMRVRQQQERQQLLANSGPNPSVKPVFVNNQQPNYNSIPNNNMNMNSNNMTMNNNQQAYFQNYHMKNKQMSETSIPSTSADPLNSNSPTPPMSSRRPQKNLNPNPANNQPNKNDKIKGKSHSQQDMASMNRRTNNQFIQKSHDENPEGSYLNSLKEARIREQRLAKDKYTANDYKTYQKNYGFGRDFLPFEFETKSEKMEKARKRDEYARMIKERNTTHRGSELFQGRYMDTLNGTNRRGKFASDYDLTSRRK